MKKPYWALSLIVLALNLNTAQAENATLQELIQRTVANNPEVQSRYHNYKAAEQEQNVARGGYYPRLDLISTIRRTERMFPNSNNTENPNNQTQLILRQMLFDGFATRSEVNRLGHAARVRYYELQSSMQSTALEVIRAYLDVQRYRQLSIYAQDNYVAHKQLFDRIEERVSAGVSRRVDLEQASGRLALAEANLLTEQTNLQNVTARYQRLTSELPPENLPEVDFYKSGVAATPLDSLKQAYQNSPDLLAAIENIVATEQEVKNRQARYSPRLDFQAVKNLNVSNNGENSLAAADSVGITATWNLFNGLADKSAISQSVEKLNLSQDLRDKACVDTRQTLVIAYNDILSLKEQLGYRDQHQLSIEKAREAYRKQFDIGQRTLLDLLDTENEYFQARRTYTITEKDLYAAYARTYASEGDLLSRLQISRSDLPEMVEGDYTGNYKTCQAAVPDLPVVNKPQLVADARPLNAMAGDKMVTTVKPDVVVAESQAVTATVNGWVDAWRNKRLEDYTAYYSPKFTPEKGTRAAWLAKRKALFAKPEGIAITLDKLQANVTGDKAVVAFQQQYTSGRFSDKVNKVLHLERAGKQWLIVKEEVLNTQLQ